MHLLVGGLLTGGMIYAAYKLIYWEHTFMGFLFGFGALCMGLWTLA